MFKKEFGACSSVSLHTWQVSIVPFGDEHWRQAADAYTRLGRGHRHAAKNFGDCMICAVAKLSDQPWPATSDGFRKTDLALA